MEVPLVSPDKRQEERVGCWAGKLAVEHRTLLIIALE